MRRDPTEFRKRFAAYKLGKLPYLAGRPIDDDEEYLDVIEEDRWINNETEFVPSKDMLNLKKESRIPTYLDGKTPIVDTYDPYILNKVFHNMNVPTGQCAEWANRVMDNLGYNTYGDAWLQHGNVLFNGYGNVKFPQEFDEKIYDQYSTQAADNLLKNFNSDALLDKAMHYIVNMYYPESPNKQMAAENGNGFYGTHTGVLFYDKDGKWKVAHNIGNGVSEKNKGAGKIWVEDFKQMLSKTSHHRPTAIITPNKHGSLSKARRAIRNIFGFADGKSPYDDDRIYTTSNYMLPELAVTPTKDSPEELAIEQAYLDRFKNKRLELPVDRTNESLHKMYKHIQKGRAEAFPYVVLALTLPVDLAGVGDLANLAQWTYKGGRKLLQKLIQPILKLPIIEDFGKVFSEYKLKPLPYDERYDIERLVNKPKLPDYSESDRFMNFAQLVLEHLKYVEALKRVNKAPDQPIPIESQNIVREQVIPRRLKSYISSQETDGVKKMKKFLEEHGIDDINVSNPELLKTLENENITLEELTDWANYKDYERQLNDYVNGKFSEIDLDDWEIAYPSESNSPTVTAGDFNPNTDAIRYINRGLSKAYKIGTLAHEMRHWMDKYVPLLQSERNALLNAYGAHSFPHTVPKSEFVTTNVDLRNILLRDNYANNASLKVQNDVLNNFVSDEEILNALPTANSYGNKIYKNAIGRLDALKQRLINLGWSQESISHLIKDLKHKWAEDLRYALTNVGSYALPITIGGTALYGASKEKKKVNPVL